MKAFTLIALVLSLSACEAPSVPVAAQAAPLVVSSPTPKVCKPLASKWTTVDALATAGIDGAPDAEVYGTPLDETQTYEPANTQYMLDLTALVHNQLIFDYHGLASCTFNVDLSYPTQIWIYSIASSIDPGNSEYRDTTWSWQGYYPWDPMAAQSHFCPTWYGEIDVQLSCDSLTLTHNNISVTYE